MTGTAAAEDECSFVAAVLSEERKILFSVLRKDSVESAVGDKNLRN